MPIPSETAVVLDVNVSADFLLGEDGTWPLMPTVPPLDGQPSADVVSLAVDGRFRLFTSPHVLHNVRRVVVAAGVSPEVADGFVAAIVEMCEFSSGAVVQPVDRATASATTRTP